MRAHRKTLLGLLLMCIMAPVGFSQGLGTQKEQLVSALDRIMNASSFRLSGLSAWDDDEAISRMEWVLDNTVSDVLAQISYLKPSEQREMYALYSDLFQFETDIDFRFHVVQVLRNLCEKFPVLKSRSLVWILTSRASTDLAAISSQVTDEQGLK